MPAIQKVADAAEGFAKRWYHNDPSPSLLVLVGISGSGKTHIAKAIFRFARKASSNAHEKGGWKSNSPDSLYLSWPETTDHLKAGDYYIIDEAIRSSLLVLDDLGAEHDPSRNAADKLCQILSRRERKFTIVTTNIIPEAWAERFDVRIADRFLRNSVVVDLLTVPSYALIP